jgi:hypothetical protein
MSPQAGDRLIAPGVSPGSRSKNDQSPGGATDAERFAVASGPRTDSFAR